MNITSATFSRGIIGTDDIIYDGKRQIAFVGRSNVGKSSLINALTGQDDLVKVGKKPGKTTEINFFLINSTFYFVDLPGYGYAQLAPVEREKIRKRMLWYVMESGAHPSLVVIVLDARVGCTEFDQEMMQVLRDQQQPFVIAANKIDKLNQKDLSHQLTAITASAQGATVVACSTTHEKGIRELLGVFDAALR
ncbi:MAG: YihA family ribosome biogenesis GTP-binding protein [Candidatus Pacebacteria bacterium]|nr:YihA family ribosome biogenesis GTP-binding protein [Candidatus Paceibacterota bacterium]